MAMRTNMSFVAPLMAVALLFLAVTGCKSTGPGKPKNYNVEVTLDSSLQYKSVLVDLVGVNAATFPRWETYSMKKYWQDGDAMRRDAGSDKVTFSFAAQQPLTNTLAATNAIWERWLSRGATHVFVLADLPGTHADQPGNQDARRQILSLDRKAWEGSPKTLKVLVKESRIEILTPPSLKAR